MSERQFALPACEKLKYLRQLKRSLPNRATGGTESAGVSVKDCNHVVTDVFDGPAYIANKGWVFKDDCGQQTDKLQASVVNLGRSYTARGFCTQNYYSTLFGGGGILRYLPGNPSRRFLAIWHAGTGANIRIGFDEYQLTVDVNGGFFVRDSILTTITDEEWGGWVTYPLWIDMPISGGLFWQVWEEVYTSYKSPTVP